MSDELSFQDRALRVLANAYNLLSRARHDLKGTELAEASSTIASVLQLIEHVQEGRVVISDELPPPGVMDAVGSMHTGAQGPSNFEDAEVVDEDS